MYKTKGYFEDLIWMFKDVFSENITTGYNITGKIKFKKS